MSDIEYICVECIVNNKESANIEVVKSNAILSTCDLCGDFQVTAKKEYMFSNSVKLKSSKQKNKKHGKKA